jgi:hypothetical protein
MAPVLLRKHNCNINKFYMDDSYIFCNYEAIFTQSIRHFNTLLSAVHRCCKIVCPDFGAHYKQYVETLNCDNAPVEFILTEI